MNFAPVPDPLEGQRGHVYTMPDDLLAVPLVCHLDHTPEVPQMGHAEVLTLDKAFAGPIDVYHLLDRHTIECIQNEALAALKKSRVEID